MDIDSDGDTVYCIRICMKQYIFTAAAAKF